VVRLAACTPRSTVAAVSTRLVDRLARPLASRRTDATTGTGSRRDLFRKAALAGTALAVAPKEFVLTPVSAYAAVCSCNGSSCDCGSLCCDGYTEFCCTTSGVNWCPSGAVTGGWWKVDSSHFCGGNAPRYYLDCHRTCGGCSCSGGICSGACSNTGCGCAGGSCGNRKSGCTRFRYGQCNRHIACLGPILCRVVSCTPPWQLDSNCSTAALTDNNTRYHHRACLEEPPPPAHNGPFRDVPPGQYFTNPVRWAVGHDITTGVGGGDYFKPHDTVIRAEAITFIWRFFGRQKPRAQNPFPDVPKGAYYERAVRWGYRKGITDGVGNTGRYEPNGPVTRAQMVTMLWRLLGEPKPKRRHNFGDVKRNTYYDQAVSWAKYYDITDGVGNTGRFQPHQPVSRAEAVTFLFRLAGRKKAWGNRWTPPTVRF
jgi:hypothetical protein